MSAPTILIVDDEKNILTTLSRALKLEDFEVELAGNATAALAKTRSASFDVVLLDVSMPGMDGITMLRTLREEGNDVPVIVMSGHGTIETALEATRLGAHDFIEKPIATERLLLSLSRCIDFHKLSAENAELRELTASHDELVGESKAMVSLKQRISRAAQAAASVLVLGERGTGKELIARAIHKASKRADGPYEKLNCAAVPAELIESELFGHESGAFTGATKQRKGKFERASGGTLFLDEVGDMPAPMQAKLLRVLQEGELERVGGSKLIKVDVRVVAATNKPLEEEIEEGRFRADLYDRLNVLPLKVPPLRERGDDVSLLASGFLAQAAKTNGMPDVRLSEGALSLLKQYSFPGNVRELKNLVERLVILSPGDEVTETDARELLPIAKSGGGLAGFYRPGTPLKQMMEEVERHLLNKALEHHSNHMTKTAADLALERSHLYKKLKALGIRRES